MKFMYGRAGQVLQLLVFSVTVSSCNPPEEYGMKEFLMGADSYCSEAKDVPSCQALPLCQPAYQDLEIELEEPVFEACIANPDVWPEPTPGDDVPPPIDDGSTTGGTTGSDDGSTTGGTTGSDDGSTTGGTTGSDDGSTAGGTTGGDTAGSDDGSTTGGDDGSGSDDGSGAGDDGSNPDDGVVPPPTVEDAYKSKCENLDEKYFYTKQVVEKKNGKESVSYNRKVKVCHLTGNSSSHTIMIACPALKAHVNHHDDYLGACQQ